MLRPLYSFHYLTDALALAVLGRIRQVFLTRAFPVFRVLVSIPVLLV